MDFSKSELFDFYDFFVIVFFIVVPAHKAAASQRLLLLGEKDGMDVGEDSTGSDGDSAQKLVELLVVLYGKGDVAGDNAGLLVVAGGVSGKLKDLSAQVLKDGGHVDTGSHTNTGSVSTLLKVACQTGNWELKPSLGRRAGALSGLSASSFSFSCDCFDLI